MTEILLSLLVLPALLPAYALLALTVAALGGARQRVSPMQRPTGLRVAVLIPAHDESGHVGPTIANVRAQLEPQDHVLVVADNCSDDTADHARRAGADVIERSDAARRGKGYALAFGVDHLRASPPDVVLIVDADCALGDGAVAAIGAACHHLQRPVQMLDLMQAPAGAGLRLRVLEFAMRVKNLVRPLGTDRLGAVCPLMGTGMALPWALIAQAPLATGHVAEDMKLGVNLTLAGHAPRFLPGARVSSAFVHDSGVARRQKARWEHGHLDTMREELPVLAGQALRRCDPALAVLALDLMIPPLALYFLLLAVLVPIAAAAMAVWPAATPAAWAVASAALSFSVAVGLAWWHYGRDLLRVSELARLPLYALWKVPVYARYLLGAHSAWVRTQRSGSSGGSA